MAGLEISSLISAIISDIEYTIRAHDALKDVPVVPKVMRDVLQRLPLVKDTLVAARDGLSPVGKNDNAATAAAPTTAAMKPVLEGCRERVDTMDKIFRSVAGQTDDFPKLAKYKAAVRSLAKGSEVDELMNSVLADVQLLAANYPIKATARSQIEDLIQRARIMPTERSSAAPTFYHTGTGRQAGNQPNLYTSADQLNGTYTGPMSFYSQ